MKRDEQILYLPGEAGERALFARLAAGEDAAYRECYQSYAPSIYRVLTRILKNQAMAEEILQDTFIAAFQSIRQFRGESRLVTWLTRIAVNRAFNLIRDEGRRSKNHPEARFDIAPEPVSQLEHRDLYRRVLDILNQMDPPKRLSLLLQSEGYSVTEIAEIMEEPRGTILARLSRGRVELGERLAAVGVRGAETAEYLEGAP